VSWKVHSPRVAVSQHICVFLRECVCIYVWLIKVNRHKLEVIAQDKGKKGTACSPSFSIPSREDQIESF